MIRKRVELDNTVKIVRNAGSRDAENAEKNIREYEMWNTEIRKCGMREMECGNADADGRGFNLYVAPSFRNRLSLICG
jgi:hypothetical protein